MNIFSLLFLNSIFVFAATDSWWNKDTVLRKIRDERQILVVVKEDRSKGAGQYSMSGTGGLKATPEFTLQKILEFDKLPKISPYFQKVVHQPELSRVYLVLEAYNYEARLLIKYKTKQENDQRWFYWSVVWGGFEGMVGEIHLKPGKQETSEAVLQASFSEKEIPLPKIFKSFILEVIIQQVAKSVRSYIEAEYKEHGKSSKETP